MNPKPTYDERVSALRGPHSGQDLGRSVTGIITKASVERAGFEPASANHGEDGFAVLHCTTAPSVPQFGTRFLPNVRIRRVVSLPGWTAIGGSNNTVIKTLPS